MSFYAEALGGARWIITGTPVDQPYPCRCHEARYGTCSPKYCPCVGRLDLVNLPEKCCAHRFGPDAYVEAWRESR